MRLCILLINSCVFQIVSKKGCFVIKNKGKIQADKLFNCIFTT